MLSVGKVPLLLELLCNCCGIVVELLLELLLEMLWNESVLNIIEIVLIRESLNIWEQL